MGQVLANAVFEIWKYVRMCMIEAGARFLDRTSGVIYEVCEY